MTRVAGGASPNAAPRSGPPSAATVTAPPATARTSARSPYQRASSPTRRRTASPSPRAAIRTRSSTRGLRSGDSYGARGRGLLVARLALDHGVLRARSEPPLAVVAPALHHRTDVLA